MQHLADLLVVNDQHQLAVLAHCALRHLDRISLRATATDHDRNPAKTAFKQLLLSCQYLSLLNLAGVVLELEQNIPTVQVVQEELPEVSGWTDAAHIVEAVQSIISSLLAVPPMKIIGEQVPKDPITKILLYFFGGQPG